MGWAIFNTGKNPAWLLAAAGCAELGYAVIHRGPFDLTDCHHQDGDTIIYYGDISS